MTNKLKFFIGNWKMFGDLGSLKIIHRIQDFCNKSKKLNKSNKIILCVPNTLINFFTSKLNSKIISIGAQNCTQHENYGPFTGSVSASMIKKAGADYVILGHSENRLEGETKQLIKMKIMSALNQKLNVIFCIGENHKEKNKGKTLSILRNQIRGSLDKKFNLKKVIIAYEPVWSIGTGKIPKNLTGNDDFNDLFFKKIDEIDDLIVEGKNFDYIIQNYNLGSFNLVTINNEGEKKDGKLFNDLPQQLIKKIFDSDNEGVATLIEHENEYFIVEIDNIENLQKEVSDAKVKKEVISKLAEQNKRKFISELISKINNKNFDKSDFDKFAKKENVVVKKIKIENQNDNKHLKKELVNQVYLYPEKSVVTIMDIFLKENFLIYIDKVKKASIRKSSKEYEKYLDLTKFETMTDLYNTYDSYLKKEYDININHSVLKEIKNNL